MFVNFGEEIPQEVFEGVKTDTEIYRYPIIKEAFDEEDLEEVSEKDLNQAIEVATGRQENYREFIEEKASRFGNIIQLFNIPIAIGENSAVGIAGSVILKKAIDGYSQLFSKEVDLRNDLIEKLAYRKVTGDKWIDNRRFAWNIKFRKAKFLWKVLLLCIFAWRYPDPYVASFEMHLCMDGKSKKRGAFPKCVLNI